MNQTEALAKIRNQECFGASDSDGIWKIRIREYVPLVCVALHDGSSFPPELEKSCLLTSEDRIFEEDPHTAELVSSQPIVVSALDSRYYYDLNRSPENCAQVTAFNRQIWKKDVHLLASLAKQRHERFYVLVNELVGKLVELFGSCLIIDVHSHNFSRIDRETPLFNLGTAELKREDELLFVQQWKQELANIRLPGVKLPVAENDVFLGQGYFLWWAQQEFHRTCLTIPVDMKKIYCDEATGEIYPLQFKRLAQELNKAILSATAIFQEGRLSQGLPAPVQTG
jgi:hypothetical protein